MAKNVYSDDFRRDVVAVAKNSGATHGQVAKDFGISRTALTSWLRKDSLNNVASSLAVAPESAQVRVLMKRIKLLEQEAEIMRRAVGYLSRGVNPK